MSWSPSHGAFGPPLCRPAARRAAVCVCARRPTSTPQGRPSTSWPNPQPIHDIHASYWSGNIWVNHGYSMGYTDIPQFSHTHILSTRSAFEPRGLPGDIPICNRPPFARMPAAANAAVAAERASGHVCRNRGAACFLPGTQPKTGETDGVFWTGLYLCVCVCRFTFYIF